MKTGKPWVATLAAVTLLACAAQARAQCTTDIGVVMELTGPAGKFGQGGAKAVELALRDLAEAGGVSDCTLRAQIRDSQSQAAVGVDAARQLVDIHHVPAIIGAVISSVTIPVLTSVTAPAGVVQIATGSTSPTLTELGRSGKSNGVFFRMITSDALQGVAVAGLARQLGFKNVVVLYVNNDYGVNLTQEFARAHTALGGNVVAAVAYNERQSFYLPEVNQALRAEVDALFLIGYPTDATAVARTWISQGGKQVFLLNDGLNSRDFIQGVGAQYMTQAYGVSSGTLPSDSTQYFQDAYRAYSGLDPTLPGVDRAYDAAAIIGLAIAQAGKSDAASIRANIRKVTGNQGTAIGAGAEEFKRGLALMRAGQAIHYQGLIGSVQFDEYGDITGPFNQWRVKQGEIEIFGEISVADVDRIKGTSAKPERKAGAADWDGSPRRKPQQ